MADLKGSFLRDDELAYSSANLFFMMINRLTLRETIFHIAPGVYVDNETLFYYVTQLRSELGKIDPKEDPEAYEYVEKVTSILHSWARSGHSMKVV